MGTKAPKTFKAVEQVLSLLHCFATCARGCKSGDHILERIAGRVFASTSGSLRLAFFGLYDESLALTRSVGEIANLLFLFVNDDSARRSWQSGSKQILKREFRPVNVRLALEKVAPFVPVENGR